MRRLITLLVVLMILLPLSLTLAQDDDEENQGPNTPDIAILVSARSDIETLATDQMGGERPVGWSGSLDINDPQLALYIRLDLDLLAGALLGTDNRPKLWYGAVPGTALSLARDIRHDLELLADDVIGFGIRPEGWIGDDPLMRCNRATQALVKLLERGGVFVLELNLDDPNYCQTIEVQATQFTEVNLLSNPNITGGDIFDSARAFGTHNINSAFAVGFLDRFTSQRAGIIPNGTPFNPIARSYAQFSNMILIRGDGFEVFIDYQFTSISASEFDALPDVNTMTVGAFCTADWCN